MKISKYYLLFTLLITGASILVIEILGARIISPYFGVSLYVWSSLITITLISLAIGYWRGGIIADSSPDEEKLFSIIFESAIYLFLIPFVKTFVLSRASALGLRIGALLSAFVLFAIPLTFLSMATPYAVRLVARKIEAVGKTTGVLYAVSTVGSFIGAILTGFFLIPLLHVDKIVYLLSLILALMVAVAWIFNRRPIKVVLAIGLIIICLFFLFHSRGLPRTEGVKVIYKTESPYGEIKIVDSMSHRSLLLSGIVQGRMNPSGFPIDKYCYFMDALIQTYKPDIKDALVLGLGIGALPKILSEREIQVDVVDIDPVVVDVAKRFFGFNEGRGRLYIEDGRYFIEKTSNTYDYIFLDSFASEILSYHLFSMESFLAMKRILREGGIVTINFHDFSDEDRALSTQSILKTLRMVFKNVLVFEIQPWHENRIRNIAFIASMAEVIPRGSVNIKPPGDISYLKIPAPINIYTEKGGILLSDGYNPIEIMYNPIAESFRKSTQNAFPKEILLD